MFVRHSVNDYAGWRKVYDDFDPVRSQLGVVGKGVYQAVGEPNDVTVTHDFNTIEDAKGFADSEELNTAMKSAGVAGQPEVWFTEPD